VSKLIDAGRVEEIIHFSPEDQVSLTYALVCDSAVQSPQVRFTTHEIVVAVPHIQAIRWAGNGQVGIYAAVDLGLHGALDLSVEKDFACMDLSDADNLDTFPNPKTSG
jgi:hypothetical protein